MFVRNRLAPRTEARNGSEDVSKGVLALRVDVAFPPLGKRAQRSLATRIALCMSLLLGLLALQCCIDGSWLSGSTTCCSSRGPARATIKTTRCHHSFNHFALQRARPAKGELKSLARKGYLCDLPCSGSRADYSVTRRTRKTPTNPIRLLLWKHLRHQELESLRTLRSHICGDGKVAGV